MQGLKDAKSLAEAQHGAMRGLNESRRYEDDEVSKVQWRAAIIKKELFHLLPEGLIAQA